MTSAQPVTRTRQFHATVSEVSQLTPKMRRLTLNAPEIADQAWPLACELAVVLTGADGREIRRRYTVRAVRADELDIDAVLHGDGAGAHWAGTAQPGDSVTFFGPRGEIPLPELPELIAVTDESGLPAVAALAAAAGRRIQVLAEIAAASEQYPLPVNAETTWLVRGNSPAGSPDLMVAALANLRPGVLADSYSYAIAESRAVMAIRDALIDLGADRSQIYFKGYWNLKSRPTR